MIVNALLRASDDVGSDPTTTDQNNPSLTPGDRLGAFYGVTLTLDKDLTLVVTQVRRPDGTWDFVLAAQGSRTAIVTTSRASAVVTQGAAAGAKEVEAAG